MIINFNACKKAQEKVSSFVSHIDLIVSHHQYSMDIIDITQNYDDYDMRHISDVFVLNRV